jgi:hypothetical protein
MVRFLTAALIILLVALVPIARLQRRMKELWLLPGLIALILVVSDARRWTRFGTGSAQSIALDLTFPVLCAAISVWEGTRAVRNRHARSSSQRS